MKKEKDIITLIEEDLSEDIIEVLKSLNFKNAVMSFYEEPLPIAY